MKIKKTKDFWISLAIMIISIAVLIYSIKESGNAISQVGVLSILLTIFSGFWLLFDQKMIEIIKQREITDLTNDFNEPIDKYLIGNGIGLILDKYEELKERQLFLFPSPQAAVRFSIDIVDTPAKFGASEIKSTLNATILNRHKILNRLFNEKSDMQKVWEKCISDSKIKVCRLIVLDDELIKNDIICDFLLNLSTKHKQITKVYLLKPGGENYERDCMLIKKQNGNNYLLQGGSNESSDDTYDGRIEGYLTNSPAYKKSDAKFDRIYSAAYFIDEILKRQQA